MLKLAVRADGERVHLVDPKMAPQFNNLFPGPTQQLDVYYFNFYIPTLPDRVNNKGTSLTSHHKTSLECI